MPTRKPVELGDEVQDPVTGLKGIAIAVIHFLTGCDQILVQPQGLTKDGEIKDSRYIDEPILKVIKRKSISFTKDVKEAKKKGGPKSTNAAHAHGRH
ncbi:MAG: hypothetical protein JRL30_25930 [Deltaproteobacteria bacterium]|nr:hypothetical protein [Deltaproteobacteria bacterium]